MKLIDVVIVASLSGCNLMPLVIEETEELVEFEIEANIHEIERRTQTPIQPIQDHQREEGPHQPDSDVGAPGAPA